MLIETLITGHFPIVTTVVLQKIILVQFHAQLLCTQQLYKQEDAI